MGAQEVSTGEVRLTAENIGGIERTDVTFDPGVTILTGRNATNRTSFLQALMAGLGSGRVSLKGDADSGHVTLRIGDDEYTRELRRQNGHVTFDGDPYLEDASLADLFGFLLESNEARRAVALEEDLRDIIMDPVDATEIQAEIRRLKAQRETVEDDIEERESLKEKLPGLEERRVDLEEQIEDKRAELEAKREELEDQSADATEARAEESELEERMETLQQTRSDLDTVEFRLDSQRESLSSLRTERDRLEDEYEDLQDEDVADLDYVTSEIERLRDQRQRLDTELNKLQNVIQFNEEMLDGASEDIAAALRGEEAADSVTDQLLDEGSSVVCWTCGTAVDRSDIEGTLERLRDLRQSKFAEQSDIEDDLDELKATQSELESTQQQREDVKRQLADVRAEIEERETKIEDLEEREEELEAEIEELEAEIEELEQQDRSEVLDVHREVNELELDLQRLESERDNVAEEIESIEEKVEDGERLQERKTEITDRLTDLRTRIDRIEEDAVDAFNEHMDTVLDILGYDNLERIWVERVQTDTRQGRRTVQKSEFRLHVVRSTDEGITYEDEFTHLSESEREVTGLIFALAGYLAHDVYEEVPFILLDSLEAIDSERIAELVEYMQEYADYLVAALLPEDAEALDEEYERVTDI